MPTLCDFISRRNIAHIFRIIDILKSLKMKLFVGFKTHRFVIVAVLFFAFAKANSQSSLDNMATTSYSITKDFDRTQLFEMIKTLQSTYDLEAKLTAYSRNQNKLKQLGIAIKPVDGKWVEYTTRAEEGIAPVCIEVGYQKVMFIKTCKSVTEIQDLPKKQEKEAVVEINKVSSRQQKLDSLKVSAAILAMNRKAEYALAVAEKAIAQNARLEETQAAMNQKTDSLKLEKSAKKVELKELQIEVNSSIRERNVLKTNNQREKARRDSLIIQQQRLQERLEQQQIELKIAQEQQAKNEQLIKEQQVVIKEQGLQSETAESLKAYRTALLGNTNGDELLKQGYLLFAMEQCLYKVYRGYTVVYGNNGNFLFTINQELMERPTTGTLKIKGRPFSYTHKANVIFIKDEDGNLVNQHGEVLSTVNTF